MTYDELGRSSNCGKRDAQIHPISVPIIYRTTPVRSNDEMDSSLIFIFCSVSGALLFTFSKKARIRLQWQ
jgi:hypothetical protein